MLTLNVQIRILFSPIFIFSVRTIKRTLITHNCHFEEKCQILIDVGMDRRRRKYTFSGAFWNGK